MNGSRTIAEPQRRHGRPSWPYTASARSKYPLAPLTFTYRASNEVPPWSNASCMTYAAACSNCRARAGGRVDVARA